jgi:hypothetical protein
MYDVFTVSNDALDQTGFANTAWAYDHHFQSTHVSTSCGERSPGRHRDAGHDQLRLSLLAEVKIRDSVIFITI